MSSPTARSGRSGSRDRPTNLFEFQDRIAASILGSLEPRVRAGRGGARRRPADREPRRVPLRAQGAVAALPFHAESYRQAGELLERAIALDPSYAQAYAYLAWWLNFRIGEGWSLDPDADRARALVVSQRAIELDREDAFALPLAATSSLSSGGSRGEAIELFDQALALNENSAFAWGLSALTLAYLGEADEALARLQNVWRSIRSIR